MTESTTLTCRCGACRMAVEGPPIQSVVCHCASCRAAAEFVAGRGGPSETTAEGGSPYVMHRKDRVRLLAGEEHLAGFRLSPRSTTRRAVATCCDSLFFTDFEKGHWLSIHAARWPEDARPAPQLRTMTRDDPARDSLPADLPKPASHSIAFMARLVGAWVRMGFRTPKLEYPRRELADG